ncbi:MAG: NOB1 family endonuclease [Candidatus Bathyarchaeia archaeon]
MVKAGKLVLDTSAFIAGLSPSSLNVETYTTPRVVKELRGISSHLRCSIATQLKKLKILNPAQSSINAVERISSALGDIKSLSKADLSILALAFELKAQDMDVAIVSDDYSVQNIAEYMGIKYQSVSSGGIRFKIRWVLRCADCRRIFPSNFAGAVCPVCGGDVRRKAAYRTYCDPTKGKNQDGKPT